MDSGSIGELLDQTMALVFDLSAPMLFAGLAVGLVISILQAATQLQEVTLVFIPKMLVVGVMMYVFGPWIFDRLSDFVTRIVEHIDTISGGAL